MSVSVHQKLLDHGIDESVANELDCLHQSGLLSDGDLDERAIDAIKDIPPEQALEVLAEFKQSNLEHVTNKSAFLCSLMKVNRQKMKTTGQDVSSQPVLKRPGPDDAKIKAILDRTGYTLDVTTGQRKYGGPPPNAQGHVPGSGHEVYCGRIPKDLFEDELIPLFEKCGTIWDLRLMMDPMTGYNRSFCFVTFVDREGANEAVKQLNGYEIRPGKTLKVNISVANVRLFVGNIPKNKTKEEILDEFRKHTEGILDVIIYNSPDDQKKKNRGFAFLEYDSHKSASMAKHRLGSGYTRVWGCDIIVDWADPLEEPDEDTMSKVKVLYVRNLKSDVSEEQLREKFEAYGKVERVKKVKDYGFVHFEDREKALLAMQELNATQVGDSEMQISLAKPPTENKQKEKRKQMQKMQYFRSYDDSWIPPMSAGPPPRGNQFFRPHGQSRPGGFRHPDFENYGYRDYGAYGYTDYNYHGPRNAYEDDFGYYKTTLAEGSGFGHQFGRGGRGGHGAGQSMPTRGSWQGPAWRPWSGGRGAGPVTSGGTGGAQWGGNAPRR